MLQTNVVLAILLSVNLVIAGVWDLYAWIFRSPDQTLSHLIWVLAQRSPIITISVGVLIGHLFWPTIIYVRIPEIVSVFDLNK